jgi:histidine triad (HIT) family protein
MTDCIFCKIASGEAPATIVHTTDTTVAFRDLQPQASTHVLVIPKRHIRDASQITDADGDVLATMLTSAKAVADAEGIGDEARGYRLVFNVGPDALNSVPHLHLHVIGGRPLTGPLG